MQITFHTWFGLGGWRVQQQQLLQPVALAAGAFFQVPQDLRTGDVVVDTHTRGLWFFAFVDTWEELLLGSLRHL